MKGMSEHDKGREREVMSHRQDNRKDLKSFTTISTW